MKQLTKYQVSIGVLVILHIVGIIGLSTEYRPWILPLTPINLLVSGYFVLRHSPKANLPLFFGIGLAAYLVEALGVHTGFPFGNYTYGASLGLQIFEVPVLIGLLWLLLLLGCVRLLTRWISGKWLVALLTGVIMTALDYLIEPVAIALDFWTWESGHIPWNNYAGWFVTATLLGWIGQQNRTFGNNKVAEVFLFVQTAFFLALNVLVV